MLFFYAEKGLCNWQRLKVRLLDTTDRTTLYGGSARSRVSNYMRGKDPQAGKCTQQRQDLRSDPSYYIYIIIIIIIIIIQYSVWRQVQNLLQNDPST